MSQFFTVAASSPGVVFSVTGSNGVSVSPTVGNVVVSGVNATTTTVGVASFNASEFTVSAGGQVSLLSTASNYVNVVGPTTYTVQPTDYYISCDTTGAGTITILLPTTTTASREFVIKDRTGFAGSHNIVVTTVSGFVPIDGNLGYIFTDGYESLEMLFNGTTYETF